MRWKGGRRSSNVNDQRGQSRSSSRLGGVGGSSIVLRLVPFLLRKPKLLLGIVAIAAAAHVMGIVDIPALLLGGQSQKSGI